MEPIPDIARARTPSGTCRSARITDETTPPAAGEAVFPEALFAADAVPAGDELALPVAAALSEQAKEAIGRAIAASRSPNTRRNYQTAWRAWEDWARGCGYPPLPARAETVAEYLTERAAAGAGASTLGMALAAIAAAHGAAGETDPTRSEGVRRTVAGLRREAAGGAQRQARPLTETALAAIAASTPPTARGRTELALCRTMRDALLRRSEAAALTWADIEPAGDGSGRLTIRRAKGDQEGRGAVVYIGTAALDALEAIRPGTAGPGAPVFASPRGPGKAQRERDRACDRPRRAAGGAGRGLLGALAPDRHGPRPQPGRDGHPRDPAGRPLGQPGDGRALHPLRERRPRRRRRLLWGAAVNARARCSVPTPRGGRQSESSSRSWRCSLVAVSRCFAVVRSDHSSSSASRRGCTRSRTGFRRGSRSTHTGSASVR